MAGITRLLGSDHELTQRLLPWYNNGTLDRAELAMVKRHLAQCDECRADAASDAVMARAVASLPLDMEHGWGLVAPQPPLGSEQGKSSDQGKSNVTWLRRRVPVGWMLAGQAAAAVLVIGIFSAIPSPQPRQDYHALSSAPAAQPANLVVVFRPSTTEAAMRSALLDAGAEVVNGPNVSGAYLLQVPDASRSAALEQLRGSKQVVLAEPIGTPLKS